jgi:hypothetical protein
MCIPRGAVGRQSYASAEGNDKSFFVQLTIGEIENIDKDITSINQVGDGCRKEMPRGEDRVIILALDPVTLHGSTRIKIGGFQVTIQKRLACPADL